MQVLWNYLRLSPTEKFIFGLPKSPIGPDRIADCAYELVDSPLTSRVSIDPMQVGKTHTKAPTRLGIFDTERHDHFVTFSGDSHFASDVFALIASIGEDEQHCPAALDRVDDFVVERLAGVHVTRRDPAFDAAPLQFCNDLHRRRAVLADVADEEEEIVFRHIAGILLNGQASVISLCLPNLLTALR